MGKGWIAFIAPAYFGVEGKGGNKWTRVRKGGKESRTPFQPEKKLSEKKAPSLRLDRKGKEKTACSTVLAKSPGESVEGQILPCVQAERGGKKGESLLSFQRPK